MCTLTGRGAASSFSSALTRGNFSSKLSSSSNMSSRTMEGFKKKNAEKIDLVRHSSWVQWKLDNFIMKAQGTGKICLQIKRFCYNDFLLHFTFSGLPLIRKLKIPWVFTDLWTVFTDLSLMRNNPCLHLLWLFLQAINIFLFIFNLFLLYPERGRRNLEESIQKENHWPQLLHVSGVECQIDHFVCFAAQFSSSPKEYSFQNLEENSWTINWKTEFPDLSLTLTISKIFPDFSLTLKNFRFSLTFPWPWQPCISWVKNIVCQTEELVIS